MKTKKLIVMSVLAALLVCSAFSVAAAQEEIPSVAPGNDTADAPAQSADTPVEGNNTSSDVGSADPSPIYEANGEPAFNANTDEGTPMLTGAEKSAELYAANSTPDYTWIAAAVGVVLAVAVGGAIGTVCYRKHAKTQN